MAFNVRLMRLNTTRSWRHEQEDGAMITGILLNVRQMQKLDICSTHIVSSTGRCSHGHKHALTWRDRLASSRTYADQISRDGRIAPLQQNKGSLGGR
jgi:hypothetical protein